MCICSASVLQFVRTSFLFWAPSDNCEPDLALSDSTPTKWSTVLLRNDPPCHPVIRRYPTNDLRPLSPFWAFQAMRNLHACFCPPSRKATPLPFDMRMSVALSKCSENSAAGPLVLLYYALPLALLCFATCAALLCFGPGRQGPPSRNQEPHKLLCDSQNASHNHLKCGIKLSQFMQGGLKL